MYSCDDRWITAAFTSVILSKKHFHFLKVLYLNNEKCFCLLLLFFFKHLFPNHEIHCQSIHTFPFSVCSPIVCVHHLGSVLSGARCVWVPICLFPPPVHHVSRGRVSADLDTVWVVSAHWCLGQTNPRLPCNPLASELPIQPTPTTLPPGTLASVPASQAQCLPLPLSSELTH